MKKRNLILGLGLSVFLASASMAGATCIQDGKSLSATQRNNK